MAGQGKAGQLPEKPRQLPFLPMPLSSQLFGELIMMTALSSEFGATGIKMTNFPPNATATPPGITIIHLRNAEGHE